MIRRHVIMGAASATLLLASCTGPGGTPAPSPTPTATATATPAPAPAGTPFPLTAAAEFDSISAEMSYRVAQSGTTLGSATTEPMSGLVHLSLGSSTSTGTFSIRRGTEQATYGSSNFFVTTSPPEPEYVFTTNGVPQAGVYSRLLLLKNSNVVELGTSSGPVLNSVSYAVWHRLAQADPVGSIFAETRDNTSVFGAQTPAADVPASGTQTYDSIVIGQLVMRNTVTGAVSDVPMRGVVTVTVNFSTGVIDMRLVLTQPGNGDNSPVRYNIFDAQGALAAGQNQFSGPFVAGGASGGFRGGFFGPQAREIGITFAGSFATATRDDRFVGAVVGRRP